MARRRGGKSNERIITGDDELDKVLKDLERRQANRMARAGLGKGSRLAATKIKAEIGSTQKHIRKAIGSSVKKSRGGVTVAKAGAAVGKSRSKPTERPKGKPGKGISRKNIHWWIMGTSQRRHPITGTSGKMPGNPIVQQAISKGLPQIKAAIKQGTVAALERAVKKLAVKKG